MRAAAVLALLLVAALAPGAGASWADDCAAGADAGGTLATGRAVDAPLRCLGAVEGSTDAADAYRFHAVAGEALRIAVHPFDAPLTFCVHGPSDPQASARLCESVLDLLAYEVVADETGTWTATVQAIVSSPASYEIALSRNLTTAAGTLAAGFAGAGLSRGLGPSAPALDGAWIALPATSSGHETAALEDASAVPLHGATLAFYDAALAPLAMPRPCFPAGNVQTCAVPAGAAWALVEATCCAQVAWRLDYYH